MNRRYALRDLDGNLVTHGKRDAGAVHRLRTAWNPRTGRLDLRVDGAAETYAFDVDVQRAALSHWLSDYFGIPLELIENAEAGFPDDTDSPGPTLIGVPTLERVADWFGGLTLDDVRGRFRANLEIDGIEPFWEDRLVAEPGRCVRFQIGESQLLGTNSCQRCIVPTRAPSTGETIHRFADTFAKQRRQTLPAWAPASRFDHFYRLAVNTSPAATHPCSIRVGDEVRILGVE